MNAAFKIMQLDYAENFIISSGELHTIKDFVKAVFDYLDLDYEKYVKINPSLITKKQKLNLFGNSSKLRNTTLWTPSVNFDGLIKLLIDEEILKHDSR